MHIILQWARTARPRKSLVACLVISTALAQSPEISIAEPPPMPVIGPLIRPFHWERRIVSQVKLTNSPRLDSLIRGGNLYLTAQDVIALVLENNIDIAIQRYGPF